MAGKGVEKKPLLLLRPAADAVENERSPVLRPSVADNHDMGKALPHESGHNIPRKIILRPVCDIRSACDRESTPPAAQISLNIGDASMVDMAVSPPLIPMPRISGRMSLHILMNRLLQIKPQPRKARTTTSEQTPVSAVTSPPGYPGETQEGSSKRTTPTCLRASFASRESAYTGRGTTGSVSRKHSSKRRKYRIIPPQAKSPSGDSRGEN